MTTSKERKIEYTDIHVELSKPMGIVFSERPSSLGLTISSLPQTGNAYRTNLLRKGDVLCSVGNVRMENLKFDDAMTVLASKGSERITMIFKRRKSKRKSIKGGGSVMSESVAGSTVVSLRKSRRKKVPSKSPTLTSQMFKTLDVLCGGDDKNRNGVCGGMWDVREEESEEESFSSEGSHTYYSSDDETYTINSVADTTVQTEVSNRDEMAVTPLARLKASENGKREILRKVAEEAGTVHLEGFEEEKGFGSPGVKGAHGRNIGEDEGGTLKSSLPPLLSPPAAVPPPATAPAIAVAPTATAAPVPELPVQESLVEEEHPLKKEIAALLQEHEPARIPVLDKLMRKFKGKEGELLIRLSDRYTKKKTMLPQVPDKPIGTLNYSDSIYSSSAAPLETASPFRLSATSGTPRNLAPSNRVQSNSSQRREHSNSHSTAPTDPSTDISNGNRTQAGSPRSPGRSGSNLTEENPASVFTSSVVPQSHLRNMSLLNDSQIGKVPIEKLEEKAMQNQKPTRSQSYQPKPTGSFSGSRKKKSPKDKSPAPKPSHRRSATSENIDAQKKPTFTTNADGVDKPNYSDPFVVKITKLVNYVYGETTKKDHEGRISTILKAYAGRELILLKLLETKKEVKKDTDKKSKKKGVPRHISYESEQSGEDSDTMAKPNAVPRKGKTKSSNGDDDTISTISYGTANFNKRKGEKNAEKKEKVEKEKMEKNDSKSVRSDVRSDKRPGDTSTSNVSSTSNSKSSSSKENKIATAKVQESKPSRSIFGSLRKPRKKEKEKTAEKEKKSLLSASNAKVTKTTKTTKSSGNSRKAPPSPKRSSSKLMQERANSRASSTGSGYEL
ncbi:hypothetical protein TrVE_jg7920 [Triparma verrucosa]|uniref:PDZ domain-containing protein n=1 Tax=Triparma verrucosa TaxID=1606542 RepID=A0A9W7C3W8_9STRA|nr:hypothetical protein TrVE_jg7920 [Triparma verrucosa]